MTVSYQRRQTLIFEMELMFQVVSISLSTFENVVIVFANRKVGWLRHIFVIHYFFKSSYRFN